MKTSFVKKLIVLCIICGAILSTVGVILYGGRSVVSYYEAKFENVPAITNVFYLEQNTVIEQNFFNKNPYIVGIDLILINVGEDNTGNLCVQLCNKEGEVLSQEKKQIKTIESGQLFTVRFENMVKNSSINDFSLRLFVEDAVSAPGVLAISAQDDLNATYDCRVNGELKEDHLLMQCISGSIKFVGYKEKTNGTKETVIASVVLIIMTSIILLYVLYHIENLKSIIAYVWQQKYEFGRKILIILGFFFVFLTSASIYKIRSSAYVPVWVIIYILLYFFMCVFYFVKHIYKIQSCIGIYIKKITREWELVVLVIISTLVRIPMFVHAQLWDGGIYYCEIQKACEAFNYSLASIWDHFRLCQHYSIVYTLFISIGEFLLPGNMTGVFIVTLLLTDGAIACVYIMFRKWWLDLEPKQAFGATLLMSVCPLFLGLFCNVSLDSLLIIFTIYLLYADYKNDNLMKTVWLLAIFQTKETGLVLVGGYLLTHIGKRGIDALKKGKKDRITYFIQDYSVICGIVGVLILCIYTIIQRGLFSWLGMSNISNGNLITKYIQELLQYHEHMINKFKILFILHFQWIPTVTIIWCWIWNRFIKKRKLKFQGQLSFMGILGFYLLSNIYLFLYPLARYHIVGAVMMWILAIIYAIKTFNPNMHKRSSYIGLSVIFILVLTQNFYYLDPLTNLCFKRFDTGNGTVLSTEINGGNFGDTFVNNYRHSYLIDLIDQMFEDGAYDSDTRVIIPYDRDYNMLYYGTGYNKETKKRVFEVNPDGQTVVPIVQEILPEILARDIQDMPRRGIMYFMPYIECNEEERIAMASTYYNIRGPYSVINWGGSLKYYILDIKY